MSSNEDDLRLNTLHRFAKHSPRLVLEEHSHCEVPAGCGGVVLRWRDPNAGVPSILHVATLGQVQAFFDGRLLDSAWLTVPLGDHVLALHLTEIEPDTSALMVGLLRFRPRGGEGPDDLLLGSAPSGSWLAAASAPAASEPGQVGDWRALDFDDSSWQPLASGTAERDDLPEDAQWRFDRLERLTARPLRVTGHEAWIRCRFHQDLPPPESATRIG